jgi:RecA-family ATPase
LSASVLPFKKTGYSKSELLAADLPPIVGILGDGQLTTQTINILAGNPGVGKTWLALALADAVANGGFWCGLPVMAGKALYVSAEMTDRQMKMRLEKLATGVADFALEFQHEMNLQDSRGQEKLWMLAEKYRPALMVIDNLRDVYRGPENSNDFISAIFHTIIERVAIRFDCCVLICDHYGKPGEFKNGAHSIRGASVKYATAADVILAVEGGEGEKARVIFDKTRFAEKPGHVEYELLKRADGKIDVQFSQGGVEY